MQDAIIEKFGMQNPPHVLENPNRPNIFYKVVKRPCPLNKNNEEQFEKLISELASELKTMKKRFPVTIAGEPATASLFYNGNDIAKNIDGMDNIMRTFCVNPDSRCRREIILKHFGFSLQGTDQPPLMCCDVCQKICKCSTCEISQLNLEESTEKETNSVDAATATRFDKQKEQL